MLEVENLDLHYGQSRILYEVSFQAPKGQITTLIGFVLYTVGAIALVIGVLQPPKEFMLAAGGSIAVALAAQKTL